MGWVFLLEDPPRHRAGFASSSLLSEQLREQRHRACVMAVEFERPPVGDGDDVLAPACHAREPELAAEPRPWQRMLWLRANCTMSCTVRKKYS